jgi:hypothetical protein
LVKTGLQSPQASSPETSDRPPSWLLSTLSHDESVRLVRWPGLVLPRVRPCNCANGLVTKTHWTSEELHCALGCWHFSNYKHIIQASLDGHWADGGKFLLSLGAYTTIPKAPCGSAFNRENSCFLFWTLYTSILPFGTVLLYGGIIMPLFLLLIGSLA